MINIYEIFEKPLLKILAHMEIEGVKIDNKFLKSLSTKFEKKIVKIQKSKNFKYFAQWTLKRSKKNTIFLP